MNFLAQKFELSRGGGAHNVRPMEGLRGFAVALVFLVHYVTLVTPWIKGSPLANLAEALHTIGNTGVDLFFVLSGYLIYGSLISRPQRFMRFMSRRIVRIYPTFIVVFAVYLALSFLFPAESKIPAPFSQGLIYVAQNFFLLPGIFPIEPMITVAWSLSYEMFYYLAIPLIIMLFGLRQRSASWRTGFFLLIAVAMLAYCAVYGGNIRLMMFVAGILLHEAIEGARFARVGSVAGFTALFIGLASTLLQLPGPGGAALKFAILFISFFILCMASFRGPDALLPRSFSWTPLRWLGNMSYSYYLLHGLALKLAFMLFGHILPKDGLHGVWIFWGLLLPMFAFTLIPTAGLFLIIERPLSLAPRREAGGTAGAPAATAGAP
ncbi:acyltransferase family protein [Undibacterium sp.]|uniref:acyltransferase family protein n=1 Tax=Undibacterium sp. TaxID=1914977 RepID=UPI00374DC50A